MSFTPRFLMGYENVLVLSVNCFHSRTCQKPNDSSLIQSFYKNKGYKNIKVQNSLTFKKNLRIIKTKAH